VDLCRLIDDLVHDQGEEVAEHDVDDRRIPVIAAPRPRPEMPASEMGESMTRSVPNSSTSPERTLNGCARLRHVLSR
jgi:hypothetical protein